MTTVEQTIETLQAAGRIEPRPSAMAAARAAMHDALAADSRRPRLVVLAPTAPSALARRLRWAISAAAAAAAVSLGVAGWNAPVGSPLHVVRVAREAASLSLLPGSAVAAIRLQDAEQHLQAAAAGHDAHQNLATAAALLIGAQPGPDADAASTARWNADMARLRALEAMLSDGDGVTGGAAPATDSSGDAGTDPGAASHASPTAGGGQRGADGHEGDPAEDRGSDAPTSHSAAATGASAASTDGEHAHDGSTPSATSPPPTTHGSATSTSTQPAENDRAARSPITTIATSDGS